MNGHTHTLFLHRLLYLLKTAQVWWVRHGEWQWWWGVLPWAPHSPQENPTQEPWISTWNLAAHCRVLYLLICSMLLKSQPTTRCCGIYHFKILYMYIFMKDLLHIQWWLCCLSPLGHLLGFPNLPIELAFQFPHLWCSSALLLLPLSNMSLVFLFLLQSAPASFLSVTSCQLLHQS